MYHCTSTTYIIGLYFHRLCHCTSTTYIIGLYFHRLCHCTSATYIIGLYFHRLCIIVPTTYIIGLYFHRLCIIVPTTYIIGLYFHRLCIIVHLEIFFAQFQSLLQHNVVRMIHRSVFYQVLEKRAELFMALFVRFDTECPSHHFFSHVGKGVSELNQY